MKVSPQKPSRKDRVRPQLSEPWPGRTRQVRWLGSRQVCSDLAGAKCTGVNDGYSSQGSNESSCCIRNILCWALCPRLYGTEHIKSPPNTRRLSCYYAALSVRKLRLRRAWTTLGRGAVGLEPRSRQRPACTLSHHVSRPQPQHLFWTTPHMSPLSTAS